MKNKLFVVGILAFMLVFGMVVIGCNNDDPPPQNEITIDGWTWSVYDDSPNKGTSTINMEQVSGSNKLKFSGNLCPPHSDFTGAGYAGCTAVPNDKNLKKFRNSDGFTFKCKGDGKSYVVVVATSNITDWSFYQTEFESPKTEDTIEISYEALSQPAWGNPQVGFEKSKITYIQFMASTYAAKKGSFSFTIWDLSVDE